MSRSPCEALAEGLVNNVVVDSPQADAYQTWQNSSTDDNKVYFDLYVFNLTNKEDFINGSAPILQEVGRKATAGGAPCIGPFILCATPRVVLPGASDQLGPYRFLQTEIKLNCSWSEGGDIVRCVFVCARARAHNRSLLWFQPVISVRWARGVVDASIVSVTRFVRAWVTL